MTTYHKKLVSLNPDMYQNISNFTALEGYKQYVESWIIGEYCHTKIGDVPKTFKEWLATEI